MLAITIQVQLNIAINEIDKVTNKLVIIKNIKYFM